MYSFVSFRFSVIRNEGLKNFFNYRFTQRPMCSHFHLCVDQSVAGLECHGSGEVWARRVLFYIYEVIVLYFHFKN